MAHDDRKGSNLEQTDVLAPQTLLAGKYELGRLLGEGGMGAVYEANHVGLGAQVAVKLLGEGSTTDPKSIARFKREAKAMGQIRHENVVQVMDTGTDDHGLPYLVMERLDGESLGSVLRRDKRLSIEVACEITCQILAGLSVAHDRGVIHRDLKPGNIFISVQSDGNKRVKILDFGISKLHDSQTLNVTAEGALVGTPNFMAPEQITGNQELDKRIDIYAVGILLYRMLAGRLPYVAKQADELYKKILAGKCKKPRDLRKDIPEALEAVIMKAMSISRSKRYADANEFRDAIRDVVVTQEVSLAGANLAVSTLPRETVRSSAAPTIAASPSARRGETGPGKWAALLVLVALAGLVAFFVWRTQQQEKNQPVAGGAPAAKAYPGEAVRFGITRYISAERVRKAMQPIVSYLSASLERNVELVVVADYNDMAGKLATGELDIAALSAYPYIRAKRADPELRLLATPVNKSGKPAYEGYILARADSGIKSLHDFKGKTFCYVSPNSTSGYFYPRALFRKEGIDPETFFQSTRFGGNHELTLRALYDRACDGAAVYASAWLQGDKDNIPPQTFTPVKSTDRIPYDAYVVGQHVSAELADNAKAALLALKPKSDAARKVLPPNNSAQIIGFAEVKDSDYDGVREIEKYLDEHVKKDKKK
jgi:serine/threonine-protein kinase